MNDSFNSCVKTLDWCLGQKYFFSLLHDENTDLSKQVQYFVSSEEKLKNVIIDVAYSNALLG